MDLWTEQTRWSWLNDEPFYPNLSFSPQEHDEAEFLILFDARS